MATTAKIARNEYRRKLQQQYKERRDRQLAIINDPGRPQAEKLAAYSKLRRMPRDASPTRLRNRCNLTGRPRGYYRKFGLSRIALRDLALEGKLPGVIKSSW